MRELPHTSSCFVCGESNAFGLKIRFETDGNIVHTKFRPKPEHIGFKQTIHGGIIATVLDEIMVWACSVQTKRFAYCAELNVRFLSPLRPGEEVLASAEMTANRKNKIFEAKGEVRDQSGRVLASATGKYLPIKETDLTAMLDDFVGDASKIFGDTNWAMSGGDMQSEYLCGQKEWQSFWKLFQEEKLHFDQKGDLANGDMCLCIKSQPTERYCVLLAVSVQKKQEIQQSLRVDLVWALKVAGSNPRKSYEMASRIETLLLKCGAICTFAPVSSSSL